MALFNASMTAEEQVWSRQLFYMLTHSVNGPALRRLESVPEVEGAEASRLFVEHHEPKQASQFLGKLRGILTPRHRTSWTSRQQIPRPVG